MLLLKPLILTHSWLQLCQLRRLTLVLLCGLSLIQLSGSGAMSIKWEEEEAEEIPILNSSVEAVWFTRVKWWVLVTLSWT